MDGFRSVYPKRRKLALSTRRKMNVLIALNSDSRKHLQDNKDKDLENSSQNLRDPKEVLSFLQSEQFHIECLKHLRKCLVHPILKGSIESSDDIIELIDEMVLTHSSVCSDIISGKSNMFKALKTLLPSMDVCVSYAAFISLEMKNFQKLSETCMDFYIDFDLLQEPMAHISRYKTMVQNLLSTASDEAYCSILKAIEMTSKNIENTLLLRKSAVRTLQIQRLLFKREPKILNPGRTVLKEGMLYKVNSRGTCLKERVFFLFSDIILCCKVLSKTSDWKEKNSLMFQALFPLNMCLVNLVMGSANQGALFKLTCGTMSYLLTSKLPGEAQCWFQELEAAIRVCQKPTLNLKPKLKRQTKLSLQHMHRISPFLKKPIKSNFQNELKDEATNSSQLSCKKPSHGSIFRLLTCTSM